jgi:hypothetical protein
MGTFTRNPAAGQAAAENNPGRRTTYARATAGYDQEFRQHLAAAIIATIARESMVADANVIAIRTTETLDALADILITTLAMVPAMDTPSRLREAAESFGKRVRREVARARAEGITDLFHGAQREGRA